MRRALPIVAAFALLTACSKDKDGVSAKTEQPAAPVSVAKVVERDAPIDLKVIGNAEA